MSIVDEDRIWFKSHHGLDVDQVAREPGLCASAILGDGPWVVTDAATDPRALANPLVAGALGLRFYLGVPLTTSEGLNLGALCVIDRMPRAEEQDCRPGAGVGYRTEYRGLHRRSAPPTGCRDRGPGGVDAERFDAAFDESGDVTVVPTGRAPLAGRHSDRRQRTSCLVSDPAAIVST